MQEQFTVYFHRFPQSEISAHNGSAAVPEPGTPGASPIPPVEHTPRRIVIVTFGSLGDLHPFLALAVELRERGHHVRIASSAHYQARIERLGFEFAAIGPDVSPEDPEILHRLMRTARGPEYLFRKLFLPHLRELYADLERVTANCDLLIASEIVFAAPVLAEKKGMPWVSVVLSPISFFSPYDPPVLPPLPWTAALHNLPTVFHRLFLKLPILGMRRWERPLREFRKELGLPPKRDVLLRGKLDAPLVLALFSRHFAGAQPDWPASAVQPGFVYFDQTAPGPAPATQDPIDLPTGAASSESVMANRLEAFLQAGGAPIVFTLGSAAVHVAGDFFHRSAEAANRLGVRAILIGGRMDLRSLESHSILSIPYADYRQLFPRCAVVVHQGGIGTTAEVLRAGVPSLVVPFNFDQPDNAARLLRLGVALRESRRGYRLRTAYYSLHRLLRDLSLREKADELARKIRAEDGTGGAVDAIERLLSAGAAQTRITRG